ncbi:MAG TPA: hypothetical protein VLG28_03005 [Acidimicrobiia bacterium]|jgi:hypothetical protein|nr:hypothetical protein [Acidimicrobiia bacterium]
MSEADADRSIEDPAAAEIPEDEKWPFGFILTIAMVSIYLAYRLIQGVVLFVDWIF